MGNDGENGSVVPPKIKALETSVINRIAAGEIIIAPANALKELLENSIDAGSTSIDILVKDGGLKLLQITDNGHGINKEDLGILCERFTTSKLSSFEDLNSIATYGFRGEALASISHIAHLTVTTRSQDSECAWRAVYLDGKLVSPKVGGSAEPRPVAGRQGTQITVEDLFFNVPSRLRAFRSHADEYNKIVDVVGRYAVHSTGLGMTCKKFGESQFSLSISQQATTQDRIRTVFGSSIANELIEFNVQENRKLGLLGATGWITNANYSAKKSYPPVFFINHRSVSCDPLKRALSHLYSTYLPKGGHAFIYISLLIAPDKLDVNIHPTKREVRFLNEEEIVLSICDSVQDALGAVDHSRSFKTQTLLQGASSIPEPPAETASQKRKYEYNTVRTDAKERKITSIFAPRHDILKTTRSEPREIPQNEQEAESDDEVEVQKSHENLAEIIMTARDSQLPEVSSQYEVTDRERCIIRLQSVTELREEVRSQMHTGLTDIFANHTFVGIVDEEKRLVALQHEIKLFLVDYGAVCYELFYQIGLSDFGNFGVIKLNPPMPILSLLEIAVIDDDTDLAPDQRTIIRDIKDQLVEMRDMLVEYFSMEISEQGDLISIPLLMKGYNPSLSKLPQFLYRLGAKVHWEEEKSCFKSFLHELAVYYVPESIPIDLPQSAGSQEKDEYDQILETRRQELKRSLESTIFPAVKRRLVATSSLLSGVIEIANLPGLYKIFERC
ncbi:histidine kinase-like ATPase [Lipomyces japonicus]|uniref:histidine kinase-like ATPase n=1 Tax=Lipomyces japonicus TaxID=56871 RepID=UPI0034CE813E